MKRNIIVLAAIVAIASIITSCTVVDTKKIATVNGEDIKNSTFNYYLETGKSVVARAAGVQQADEKFWTTTEIDGKKVGDVAKDKALEEAINDVIVSQKAKEFGITIDEAAKQEVLNQKGQFIQQFGGKTQYEAEIKKYNITDADITSSIEKSYLRNKLMEKLSTDDASFKVDDAAIKDFVLKNYIRARHILIMTMDDKQQPLPEDAQTAAKAKAEKLLADVKGGANFVKVMETESQDPGSKSNPDGYIFGKGEMVKEFEDAAKALKVGDISDLVKTNYGYHIIKRENLEEKYDTFIADQTKKQTVENALKTDKFDAKLKEWKNASKIDINKDGLNAIVVK